MNCKVFGKDICSRDEQLQNEKSPIDVTPGSTISLVMNGLIHLHGTVEESE